MSEAGEDRHNAAPAPTSWAGSATSPRVLEARIVPCRGRSGGWCSEADPDPGVVLGVNQHGRLPDAAEIALARIVLIIVRSAIIAIAWRGEAVIQFPEAARAEDRLALDLREFGARCRSLALQAGEDEAVIAEIAPAQQ